MKKQILFSNRNWKHELRLEIERQNMLREAEIAQETSRATAIEDELRKSIATVSDERYNNDSALAQRIDDETTRATAIEDELQTSIDDETLRATAAEDELMNRIKGTSTKSNPGTDPFKFLGEYNSNYKVGIVGIDLFSDAINKLTTQEECGYYRAKVDFRDIEINNILLSVGTRNILQVVKGAVNIANNAITNDDSGVYRILYRQHANDAWGKWKEYVSTSGGDGSVDLSGYVTRDEFEQMESDTDLGFVNLANRISELKYSDINDTPTFKTINGASIIGSGNIEISGGDGSVDLSGYVTRDEFDTLNTSAVKAIQINGNAYIPDEDGFVNLGNITDGGIASESDPLFTASPAATITEENIKQWNAKADASAIPTKLSQLTDDVGYLTGAAIGEQVDGVEQAEGSSINYDLNIKAVNHRGYSYEAPENTIPAYILSKKKGFTYVGGDISFTKDSVAVLLHDATIDRTSNGSGNITALNYQEVLQYDFGSWFSPEYAGVRIATFKEWIMLCKNLGLHPYIELKSAGEYTQAQITQVVGEVEECGMRGKVTYISFSDTYLGYVKNADASARLGLLANPLNSSKISQAKALKTTTNEVFLDAELSTVTDALISTLIINDQPLEVWTVNTEEEILNMPSYVSGVTSDHIIAGKVLYKNALTYVPPVSTWIPTTAITLDKSSLAISSLEPITLVATVEPSDSSEPVVWTSSNPSVATVDNGVVTPIAEGSCTITATSGSHSASCSLAVTLVSYNITRNLQGCELSNTIDKIVTGNVYEANVLPNEGYGIKDAVVSITMGGVDITSTSYSNGVISISEVTGDVIINVRCAEAAEMNEMTLDVSRLNETVLI